MDTHTRLTLLRTARLSISHTLETGFEWLPKPSDYPAVLHVQRATFVTLLCAGRLRGCIGNTEATDPVIVSAARYAHAAAFRDPRFPPVTVDELESININLSLLTPEEELDFESDAGLIGQLRPGQDGLVIACGDRRATFLPSVWDTLPEPAEFLRQLKLKGGLPTDRPPQRAWRYATETISEGE